MKLIILSALITQTTFAQTPLRTCEATCFGLRSNGVSLVYEGKRKGFGYSNTIAFSALQHSCEEGLLLNRSFKVVEVVENQSWNKDEDSEVIRREWNYHFQVIKKRDHKSIYTLSSPDLQAKFKYTEASEQNACRPAREDELPQYPTDAEGNIIAD